ncbi:unnamed protein product [Caenorhabditis auriculariae]|uniref:DH domain-containing protein n=1 Tax=Caenorhabditis auriculariae TaxID=2777116 RepID=A0A8S1GS06_9PELO|nr:unnamed protein product [Caenorhabditis auriculariae]
MRLLQKTAWQTESSEEHGQEPMRRNESLERVISILPPLPTNPPPDLTETDDGGGQPAIDLSQNFSEEAAEGARKVQPTSTTSSYYSANSSPQIPPSTTFYEFRYPKSDSNDATPGIRLASSDSPLKLPNLSIYSQASSPYLTYPSSVSTEEDLPWSRSRRSPTVYSNYEENGRDPSKMMIDKELVGNEVGSTVTSAPCDHDQGFILAKNDRLTPVNSLDSLSEGKYPHNTKPSSFSGEFSKRSHSVGDLILSRGLNGRRSLQGSLEDMESQKTNDNENDRRPDFDEDYDYVPSPDCYTLAFPAFPASSTDVESAAHFSDSNVISGSRVSFEDRKPELPAISEESEVEHGTSRKSSVDAVELSYPMTHCASAPSNSFREVVGRQGSIAHRRAISDHAGENRLKRSEEVENVDRCGVDEMNNSKAFGGVRCKSMMLVLERNEEEHEPSDARSSDRLLQDNSSTYSDRSTVAMSSSFDESPTHVVGGSMGGPTITSTPSSEPPPVRLARKASSSAARPAGKASDQSWKNQFPSFASAHTVYSPASLPSRDNGPRSAGIHNESSGTISAYSSRSPSPPSNGLLCKSTPSSQAPVDFSFLTTTSDPPPLSSLIRVVSTSSVATTIGRHEPSFMRRSLRQLVRRSRAALRTDVRDNSHNRRRPPGASAVANNAVSSFARGKKQRVKPRNNKVNKKEKTGSDTFTFGNLFRKKQPRGNLHDIVSDLDARSNLTSIDGQTTPSLASTPTVTSIPSLARRSVSASVFGGEGASINDHSSLNAMPRRSDSPRNRRASVDVAEALKTCKPSRFVQRHQTFYQCVARPSICAYVTGGPRQSKPTNSKTTARRRFSLPPLIPKKDALKSSLSRKSTPLVVTRSVATSMGAVGGDHPKQSRHRSLDVSSWISRKISTLLTQLTYSGHGTGTYGDDFRRFSSPAAKTPGFHFDNLYFDEAPRENIPLHYGSRQFSSLVNDDMEECPVDVAAIFKRQLRECIRSNDYRGIFTCIKSAQPNYLLCRSSSDSELNITSSFINSPFVQSRELQSTIDRHGLIVDNLGTELLESFVKGALITENMCLVTPSFWEEESNFREKPRVPLRQQSSLSATDSGCSSRKSADSTSTVTSRNSSLPDHISRMVLSSDAGESPLSPNFTSTTSLVQQLEARWGRYGLFEKEQYQSWHEKNRPKDLSTKAISKQDAIYELFLIEKRHCANVALLLQGFRLRMLDEQVISVHEANILIPDVLDPLMTFHLRILERLRERMSESVEVSSISDIIVEELSPDGMYTELCINAYTTFGVAKQRSDDMYTYLISKNSKFADFIRRVSQEHLYRGQEFKALTAKIIGRATKYSLLLETILKSEVQFSTEYELTQKALEMSKRFAAKIDNNLCLAQLHRRWEEIRAQIDPASSTTIHITDRQRTDSVISPTFGLESLNVEGRVLRHVGEVYLKQSSLPGNSHNHSSRDRIPVHLVLFDDILVILYRKGNRIHFLPDQAVFPLETLIIRTLERGLSVMLISRTKPTLLEIEFSTRTDRSKWTSLIENAISNAPKNGVRLAADNKSEIQRQLLRQKKQEDDWLERLIQIFASRASEEDVLSRYLESRLKFFDELRAHISLMPFQQRQDIPDRVRKAVSQQFRQLRNARTTPLNRLVDRMQRSRDSDLCSFFDDEADAAEVPEKSSELSDDSSSSESGSTSRKPRRFQTFHGTSQQEQPSSSDKAAIRRHTTVPRMTSESGLAPPSLLDTNQMEDVSEESVRPRGESQIDRKKYDDLRRRLPLGLSLKARRASTKLIKEVIELRKENHVLRNDSALVRSRLALLERTRGGSSLSSASTVGESMEALRRKEQQIRDWQKSMEDREADLEGKYREIDKQEAELSEKWAALHRAESRANEVFPRSPIHTTVHANYRTHNIFDPDVTYVGTTSISKH